MDRFLTTTFFGVSCVLIGGLAHAGATGIQDDEAELEILLEEERGEADGLRRRGRIPEALEILKEHLREEPNDAASRILRAACRMDRGDWEEAESDLERALADTPDGLEGLPSRRAATRLYGELCLQLGRGEEALSLIGDAEFVLVY